MRTEKVDVSKREGLLGLQGIVVGGEGSQEKAQKVQRQCVYGIGWSAVPRQTPLETLSLSTSTACIFIAA